MAFAAAADTVDAPETVTDMFVLFPIALEDCTAPNDTRTCRPVLSVADGLVPGVPASVAVYPLTPNVPAFDVNPLTGVMQTHCVPS